MHKRAGMLGWSIVWLLALMAGGGLLAQPAGAPRIHFLQDTFDFGTMYQEEEVCFSFAFRNAGQGTLKVEKVNSSCGCTAALPDKRELAPGEQGEIKITFRSGSMQGRVTKHVYVESNDPLRPRVTLTITGEIRREVEITPRGVFVGSIQPGETIERSVEIRPVAVKEFKILQVSTNHPALHVEKPVRLADVPASGAGERGGYRLTIRFGPAAEPGRVNAKVIVRTDLEHARELTIAVYGRVAEPGESQEPRNHS